MGFFIRRQEGIVMTGIAKLAIISFIASFAFAFMDTIWSVYLYGFVQSNSIVGFISSFLTLISFISFFIMIPVIEKVSKSKIYAFTLFMFAISYILFAINTKFYFVLILAFIITILNTLRITSFGIIVRDKSSERNLSRNEGLMYTFMNIAWLIGPLIAGIISEFYGISRVFLLSAFFIIIALFLFKLSKISDVNTTKKIHGNLIKNFFAFFKSKDRILAYVLGGGVNLWWSLIYLFMPLYIIENGLEIQWVGYFLFAVVIPLILLQYFFSKLAGKVGFKKIFKAGFFIPASLVLICFFITNVYFVLGLLVLASVGLAMLEANTEAYFFDILKNKKDELKFYGPYNTTINANNFFAGLFSGIILLFLPFRFLFLLYAGFMFIFFFVSFKVRNIIEHK